MKAWGARSWPADLHDTPALLAADRQDRERPRFPEGVRGHSAIEGYSQL